MQELHWSFAGLILVLLTIGAFQGTVDLNNGWSSRGPLGFRSVHTFRLCPGNAFPDSTLVAIAHRRRPRTSLRGPVRYLRHLSF